MVTLVDTDLLPLSERRAPQVGARLEAAIGGRIRFPDRRPPARARLDAWDLAGLTVTRAEYSGGLELTRSARQAREDTPPLLSFAVHEVGATLEEHLDGRHVLAAEPMGRPRGSGGRPGQRRCPYHAPGADPAPVRRTTFRPA